MPDLTAERLRELLDYDPETGVFTRLTDNGRGCHVGDIAGSKHHSGYHHTYIGGRSYSLHRLEWLHVTGVWPEKEIDHLDRDKSNNRFANLRDTDRRTNMQNVIRAKTINECGLAGVGWRKDRQTWTSAIRIDGKTFRLGTFKTAEEAHAAYLSAKAKHHKGYVP